MKKLTVLVITAVCCISLFAANSQKIWSTDDDIFPALETLYVMEGRALPSSTGPWSSAELVKMLNKVSRETSPSLYDFVYNLLNEEPRLNVDEAFSMTFGGNSAITAFVHSNKDFSFPYDPKDDYLFKINNEKPTLDVRWESWVGKNFYGFVSYQFENESKLNGRKFSSYLFNFDVAFLSPEGPHAVVCQSVPYRAFFSAGDENWNLQFGRDRLVAGSGETGNLMLSDNFRFHNLLKYSAFGSRYKYSFIMSFLPHPVETGMYNRRTSSNDSLFFYMAHRLEGRFLNDKLSVGVTEAIVYQSEDGVPDLRFINPMMYYHNYFIKSHANSMVGLEASYGLTKHFSLYAQGALDDASSPIEGQEGDSTPSAWGFLCGVKTAYPMSDGVFKASLEGVYTFPYLYLRSYDGNDQKNGEYGVNYVGFYRSLDGGCYYEPLFLGYTYGGDAIVGDLKVSYSKPDKYSVGAELFVMIHGEKAWNSLFLCGTDNTTPSGDGTLTSYAELSGKYRINKYLSAYGQYDFIICGSQKDNQFALGIEAEF